MSPVPVVATSTPTTTSTLDLDKYLFPLSNQIQIKFYFVKKKSNQIKSNFLDYDLYFKFVFKLFASTKIKQIKSNQICGIIFFISNFFQIFGYNKNKSNQIKSNFLDHDLYFKFFFKFLGLRFNLPNQIKSNFVAIIWPVKLKQINLIWFDLNHF